MVRSNGEMLVVENIVRNGSLWWSNMVFEKEVISHLSWGLEFKHLKTLELVRQGCFFFYYSLAFLITNWAQISTDLLMHMLGYTTWEYWSLTNTRGVQCLKFKVISSTINSYNCHASAVLKGVTPTVLPRWGMSNWYCGLLIANKIPNKEINYVRELEHYSRQRNNLCYFKSFITQKYF